MIERFLNYIKYEKRYSKHTSVSYKNDLEAFAVFILKEFSIENLSEINTQHIRSWLMHLSEQSLTEKSINRKIATLKSFYKFLQKQEHIFANPADRIRTLKAPKKLPTFVQEAPMQALLEKIPFTEDFKGVRDKLIIELLYGTGIRLSELIGMTEYQVNGNSNILKVLGKGDKERIIPINHSLSQLIKDYLVKKKEVCADNTCEYFIVTDNYKKTYPMFILRIVKRYLSYVTTNDKKSPHTLRHTFATHLLNRGADLNAIKELLGHSSLAATQVYTHNSIDKLKSVFEKAHPKA
ncbi:MAG TPA: tyrosine-type recombinase/integrase [Cytophagales bacterium]|nr:tyrosine-type recombinase/integrase [Cytophagales bacterium]